MKVFLPVKKKNKMKNRPTYPIFGMKQETHIFFAYHLKCPAGSTIQLLPLSEGDMTICSPEAGNIARGRITLIQGQQLFYYTEPLLK